MVSSERSWCPGSSVGERPETDGAALHVNYIKVGMSDTVNIPRKVWTCGIRQGFLEEVALWMSRRHPDKEASDPCSLDRTKRT